MLAWSIMLEFTAALLKRVHVTQQIVRERAPYIGRLAPPPNQARASAVHRYFHNQYCFQEIDTSNDQMLALEILSCRRSSAVNAV